MRTKGVAFSCRQEVRRLSILVSLSIVATIFGHFVEAVSATPKGKIETKTNPKDALNYVLIEPGRFRMGCSPEDGQCDDVERPSHSVRISRAFWIGQTEVTQAAYKKVVGSNLENHFQGDQLPVDSASWDDAQVYCEAIGMRLPTEAEYEYAARGDENKYEARYGPLVEIAWYDGNSSHKTHEVGKQKPNDYGLYDMMGNVWEWVADWYGSYTSGEKYPEQDPRGPANAYYRVLRGGAANSPSRSVRVSYRIGDEPSDHGGGNYLGFRCAANDPVAW
jgi:formylglycine-generating enzyme required for sulfatase activity